MKGKPALIIILISVISLMTAFGLIMAFYISEREFQGEKTLSIVRFTSADEKTEAAGDLKLVSTPDFILIEFDGHDDTPFQVRPECSAFPFHRAASMCRSRQAACAPRYSKQDIPCSSPFTVFPYHIMFSACL